MTIVILLLFLILLCLLPRAVYSFLGYLILLVLGLWFLQEHPSAVKPIVVVGGGLMVFGLYVIVAAKLEGITPEEFGRRAVKRWLKSYGLVIALAILAGASGDAKADWFCWPYVNVPNGPGFKNECWRQKKEWQHPWPENYPRGRPLPEKPDDKGIILWPQKPPEKM